MCQNDTKVRAIRHELFRLTARAGTLQWGALRIARIRRQRKTGECRIFPAPFLSQVSERKTLTSVGRSGVIKSHLRRRRGRTASTSLREIRFAIEDRSLSRRNANDPRWFESRGNGAERPPVGLARSIEASVVINWHVAVTMAIYRCLRNLDEILRKSRSPTRLQWDEAVARAFIDAPLAAPTSVSSHPPRSYLGQRWVKAGNLSVCVHNAA